MSNQSNWILPKNLSDAMEKSVNDSIKLRRLIEKSYDNSMCRGIIIEGGKIVCECNYENDRICGFHK